LLFLLITSAPVLAFGGVRPVPLHGVPYSGAWRRPAGQMSRAGVRLPCRFAGGAHDFFVECREAKRHDCCRCPRSRADGFMTGPGTDVNGSPEMTRWRSRFACVPSPLVPARTRR
jgi:hypothetical protein